MNKIYSDTIEQTALDQFNEALALPCFVQGALMPDAHTGYTLPIGAVVKTKLEIFPSFVGYDIGCGVCAVRTNIKRNDFDKEQLVNLKNKIIKNIPIGKGKHSDVTNIKLFSDNITEVAKESFYNKGVYQYGTLGGGNHFIEIGYDQEDFINIVIHSGSRGLGFEIADYYMRLASKDFEKVEGFYSLNINSQEGQDYIRDMNFALEFALLNRQAMIDIILVEMKYVLNKNIQTSRFINKNHNHAEIVDNEFIIHRKGATQADLGMMGVIPGNMRDGSFIVKGKGNKDSLNSSSHGAGRVLSRAKAKETLDLKEFNTAMENIVTNHNDHTIEESPKAYKNIFEVMDMQKDLVEVIDRVIPILNIKG